MLFLLYFTILFVFINVAVLFANCNNFPINVNAMLFIRINVLSNGISIKCLTELFELTVC